MANEETAAAPAKRGGRGLILWVLLAVFALGAGASAPWVIGALRSDAHAAKRPESASPKKVAVPFGDVTVNIDGGARQARYLRTKILLAVDEADSHEVTELLNKQKPFLKNWLIGYLSDQTAQEVNGKASVARLRREIRDQFNALLFPNGEEKVSEILIDEFLVQYY